MTPDKHQMERMRAWVHWAPTTNIEQVDWLLAEFDKRFPAPAAVEPEPRITIEWPACGDAELATLREKARYWDAMWPVWYGQEDDAIHAARKVIDAGALK